MSGTSALAVYPFAVCRRHSPLGSDTVPGTNPRAHLQVASHFAKRVEDSHGGAVLEVPRRRVVGCISSRTSGRGSSESVELIVRSLAGEMSASGNSVRRGIRTIRVEARRALRDRVTAETDRPCRRSSAASRPRTARDGRHAAGRRRRGREGRHRSPAASSRTRRASLRSRRFGSASSRQAEQARQFTEDLSIRSRLAERLDDRSRQSKTDRSIGARDVVALRGTSSPAAARRHSGPCRS